VDHPGLLTIWSAQHSKTHDETFYAMQAFAERIKVKPHIQKVYTGAGDEEVRFLNGSRILFGARERGFGRGIPGVDILIMDEGQILSDRALQNMLATLNTSKFGLHIYCGTPPYPEDNSETFTRMRDEALSGTSKHLVWIECGADDDADINDKKTWAVNPSYPHRTPIEAMMRLKGKLTEEGFRKEALGIWDVHDGTVFDLVKWKKLVDLNVEPPTRAVLVIDVSPNREWSSIGVASEIDDDRTLVMVHSMRGTTRVVPKVAELMAKCDIIDVSIFAAGQARVLEPELVQAGIEYERMTATDMGAAQGALRQAVDAETVVHCDQPQLNTAIANVKTRYLQSGESEQIDRRGRILDLSPVMAAAGAFYRFGMVQSPMPFVL
jgi:hypothetical protein